MWTKPSVLNADLSDAYVADTLIIDGVLLLERRFSAQKGCSNGITGCVMQRQG